MVREIEIGDELTCIDNTYSEGLLSYGKTYILETIDGGFVALKGIDYFFIKDKFLEFRKQKEVKEVRDIKEIIQEFLK